MNEVAIVIINWNNSNTTLNCLRSIKDNYRIIIVDNNSAKDEVEKLKMELPENAHLILNDKNYGFAVANNQGIRYAIEHFRPDYIMLLNHDTISTLNFLEPLVRLMQKDHGIGAVQPKILRLNNGVPRVNTRGSNRCAPPRSEEGRHPERTFIPGFTPGVFPRRDKSTIDSAGQITYSDGSVRDIDIGKIETEMHMHRKEIFGACAAAVLYRTNALLETGLFDERLFILFEDVDISWRLRLKGYKIFYEPDSVVYHERGISKPGQKEKYIKVLQELYGFRNCLAITLKYYPLHYIIKFLPVHIYRLIMWLKLRIRHDVKIPSLKFILSELKERKMIQKSPFIKDIQRRWIVKVSYKDILNIRK